MLLQSPRGILYRVVTRTERQKFNQAMDVFHPQGHAKGSMMRAKRDLVYAIEGDWCALMTIHLINNFSVSRKYKLNMDHTWMLRRIVSVPMAKTKHGDVAVEALKALETWLRESGAHAIITLTLPRHSGGLYKKAGYEQMGRTVRGDKVWWIRRLR